MANFLYYSEDHAIGLATFTIMAGLGGSLGYAMGGIDWGPLGKISDDKETENLSINNHRDVFWRPREVCVHHRPVYLHSVCGDHHHFL